jgi:hypothetical protein
METHVSIYRIVPATLLLVLSVIELIKGLLILFKGKYPLLLMVQITLLLIKVFPIDQKSRYVIIMDAYRKKIKMYGLWTTLGALLFIYAAVQIIIARI